jgi:hypothetical protein
MLGGGIAMLDTPLWQLLDGGDEVVFEGNTANRGSAVFMAAVSEGGVHSNVVYRNNKASIGGTVFWLSSAYMPSEPTGVNTSDVLWEGNEAGYGNTLATQAVDLLGPIEYYVTVYGLDMSPPMELAMTDHYGQFIPSDSFSTVFMIRYCCIIIL